ncbi:MAG: fused MFS/spermidine synthase [Deltaproteobacteria bacterium]|nr:fused MFS/spermidine synthase [Deltaproteobacteria bacterium]
MIEANGARVKGALYGATVFLTAGGALVLEIVAGRLLAPYVGMSLYTWSSIIAVVLTGLTVGHWVGGRLAGSAPNAATATRRVALALGLAALNCLGLVPLLRLSSGPLLSSTLSPLVSILLLSAVLFFFPSLFCGVVSPVLTKLAMELRPEAAGPVLGRMFALGAAGSIAGTLLTGFVLVAWVGSIATVLGVAVLYAVLATVLAILAGRPRTGVAGAVGGALLLALGSAGGAFATHCTEESNYYCLRVVDFSPASGTPSAALIIDHLVHSINDQADPTLLYSPYMHFIDEKLRADREGTPTGEPFAAFFIGGGGYTLPRAWQQDFPQAELYVAELDPQVTLLAMERLWLRPRENLHIAHADARAELQRLPREPRFDVVFGDAFHDLTIPQHLVTREFQLEVRARLKPGGVYAINVVETLYQPHFLMSLLKTLAQDFKSVEVWVDSDSANKMGRASVSVIASDMPSPAGKLVASRGIARSWLRWSPERIALRILEPGLTVLTDDYAPVERLMAHLILSRDADLR